MTRKLSVLGATLTFKLLQVVAETCVYLVEWTRQVQNRLYLRSCIFVGNGMCPADSHGRCLRRVHTAVIGVCVFTCSLSPPYCGYVRVGFVGWTVAATLSFLVYLGEYRVPLWTLQCQPSKKGLLWSSFFFISFVPFKPASNRFSPAPFLSLVACNFCDSCHPLVIDQLIYGDHTGKIR